jgi:hypothetical protein
MYLSTDKETLYLKYQSNFGKDIERFVLDHGNVVNI